MRTPHIVIGIAAVTTVALSSLAVVVDPGPIDEVAASLIAVGLMIAAIATLAGLSLARAPWGRWGLAGTVVLGLALSSVSSATMTWIAYATGAVALVGLFGPWLRLWIRHRRVADAPGPVPLSLISVAAVAALYVGLCAFDGADWTHWILVLVAIGSSITYAQGMTIGIWGFRIAVPATGVLAATHTTLPGLVPLIAGVTAVTVLGWLPAARRVTTVITPPLPPPIRRSAP